LARSPGDLATKTHVAASGSFHGGGGSQESVSAAKAAACATNPVTEREMANNRPTPDQITGAAPKLEGDIGHGSVLIAAITSCTNTSNPSVMLAAGLLAKKAVEKGLKVNPVVKSSLAPGSRVVTDYLNKTGLTPYLDQLGFQTVGYGCTTCIGNSGPLHPAIEEAVVKNDLVRRVRPSRATATSRPASTRTSRPTSSCRPRSSSPSRSPAGSTSTWRPRRSAWARTASRSS